MVDHSAYACKSIINNKQSGEIQNTQRPKVLSTTDVLIDSFRGTCACMTTRAKKVVLFHKTFYQKGSGIHS